MSYVPFSKQNIARIYDAFLTFLGDAVAGVGEEPARCKPGDGDVCLAVVPGGRTGES